MIFFNYSKKRLPLIIIGVILTILGVVLLIYQPSEKENINQPPIVFGNDQLEKAITEYLLTERHFSWTTKDDSRNFCSVEKLDQENDLFPLYIWAYCAEYAIKDGGIKTLSGSSGPAEINYPNELSFYDLSRFSYKAPGDGSQYGEDIKRIFPDNLQNIIFNFDRDNIIRKNETAALAWFSSSEAGSANLWELVKKAVNDCEASKVWQTHAKIVKAELKNGGELTTLEPEIDEIIKIVDEAEPKCGKIPIGTE